MGNSTSELGPSSTAQEVGQAFLERCQGSNIVMTGATDGIGFETAAVYGMYGANLYIGARSKEKAEKLEAEIQRRQSETGLKGTFHSFPLDLSSLSSAKEFCLSLAGIDIDFLIFNAGIAHFAKNYTQTVDEFEEHFQINYLSHFLIYNMLEKQLRHTDEDEPRGPRVISVSSGSHRQPEKLDISRLAQCEEGFNSLTQYGQSKLCQVLFTRYIQKKWIDEGKANFIAASLHPGALIKTNITRESTAATILVTLFSPFTKSIEQGAATTVFCTLDPKIEGGEYYDSLEKKECSKEGKRMELASELWEHSMQLIQKFLE